MPYSKHVILNVVLLFAVSFFDHSSSNAGVGSFRSQYGIEDLEPQEYAPAEKKVLEANFVSTVEKTSNNLRTLDYNDTEERSSILLSQPALKESFGLTPSSGKCYKEVLTRTLVKEHLRVPPGNGSNPSVSIIETCCDGYEPYVHNRSQCVPICKNGCANGFCVAPNICECFPDHVRSLNNDCVSTCPIGCLNGQCHWNGTCCCRPGYILIQNQLYCSPLCSEGCGEFFNCTAPELCTCVKGYKLNAQSGKCEPECIPTCGSGQCVSPGICSCYSGFLLKNSTCQANCSRGCEGGRCVANEVCNCDPGWTLDRTGIRCVPYCSGGCPHGRCTAPEKCTCDAGYHKVRKECKPHCPRGCIHGKCTAPNMCTCKAGYYLNRLGTKCKLLSSLDEVLNYPPAPMYNPTVEVHPIPAPPIAQPPLYNPSVIVQPVNPAPNYPVPLNQSQFFSSQHPSPSAPEPPLHNPLLSEEYNRQPAYNPHLSNPKFAQNFTQNSTTLPRQPAFNPFFNTPASNGDHTTKGPNPTKQIKNNGTTPEGGIRKYHPTQSIAAPTCIQRCLNGKCTGRNHCTCNSGYVMASGSKHKCIPYCRKGCPKGSCTAPDRCTCNIGYKKKNNVYVPKSKQ